MFTTMLTTCGMTIFITLVVTALLVWVDKKLGIW
jgi:hypothetical protein